jgi:transcriptional regulator with XRE-family HTH domain
MQNDLFKPLKIHRLKPLLKQHNIRQAQAADKLGVSLAYLNMVLNGHTRPSKRLARNMTNLAARMSYEEKFVHNQS